MKRLAAGFLVGGWEQPRELYGCGSFANDSWRVFCHGRYAEVAADKTADRNVRLYARHCVQLYRSTASGADTAGSAADDTEASRPQPRAKPVESARAKRAKRRRAGAKPAAKVKAVAAPKRAPTRRSSRKRRRVQGGVDAAAAAATASAY